MLSAGFLLAFVVVRVAVIQAFAAKDPGKAQAIWPRHPEVVLESGLARIGEAAASGKPVDRVLIERLVSAGAMAPLAPEPFLVRGVDAQVSGDLALAHQSFLEARQRNPRFIAPRYFLADYYLKLGQVRLGLTEISALSRLVPQSLPNIVPYLASYARTPAAVPQVKAMLQDHPSLEFALLNELAADPKNAQLIVEMWSGRGGRDAQQWQGRLLNSLVEAGRYADARANWARFTRISAETHRLFDPDFEAGALPPFGWTLASGPAGIAEPKGGGRLHVIYYGRDDLVLANQLLTLPPGRYRLSMHVDLTSSASKSLSWKIRCLPASDPLASVPMDRPGGVTAAFSVAPSCSAQRLELVGDALEFPERAELTVRRLRLDRNQEP